MNGIWLARGPEVTDTVNGGGGHFLALYGALLVALLVGWFWRSRRR